MTSTLTDLRLGVTLHSFAQEYCSYVWSFDDLLELTSHLGGGVEIVGPSHQRGYPNLTPEFEASFKSAVRRHGLTPTSYGSYADPFMLPDRDLTDDEMLAYHLPQLESAARLGFPIVRLQHFASNIIEPLLERAEKLDLRLGYELHVPMTIESERGSFLISQVQSMGTERLGIIPDAGIFARSIADRYLEDGRALGVDASLVDELNAAWHADADLDAALEIAGNPDEKSPVRTWIGLVWDTFGRSEPERLMEVMEHVIHFHAKFFTMYDGDEPDLRYEEMIGALVRGGYNGWISSEFEGSGSEDSFEVLAAQHEMMKRYAAQAAGDSVSA